MAKQSTFLLLAFLLTSLAAQAQIARNGFENTAADTWGFTATPAK